MEKRFPPENDGVIPTTAIGDAVFGVLFCRFFLLGDNNILNKQNSWVHGIPEFRTRSLEYDNLQQVY